MWVFVLVMVVLFFDQVTKYLIFTNLAPSSSIPVIKNILHVTYVRNTGAAFGILINQTAFFIIISIIAIASLIFFIKKCQSYIVKLSLILILSGAVGNLTDRLRFGFVIDFIDFRIWPVFNVADSSVTIGVILLSWQILLKGNKPGASHIM